MVLKLLRIEICRNGRSFHCLLSLTIVLIWHLVCNKLSILHINVLYAPWHVLFCEFWVIFFSSLCNGFLMQEYKQVRNRVNKLNLDLKSELFSKETSSYAGDIKGSWKIIDQALNKKSKTIMFRVSMLRVKQYLTIRRSLNPCIIFSGRTHCQTQDAVNPLLGNKISVDTENADFI